MALQVSTRFKELLFGGTAFADIFRDGVIYVYSGAQPATADAAATGTLLARVTSGGGLFTPGSPLNGLRFSMAGPFVIKDPIQDWTLTGLALGTAGWFRLMANQLDPNGLSYNYPRIDGNIGSSDSGAVLRLSSVIIENAQEVQIQQFILTIPPIIGV